MKIPFPCVYVCPYVDMIFIFWDLKQQTLGGDRYRKFDIRLGHTYIAVRIQ